MSETYFGLTAPGLSLSQQVERASEPLPSNFRWATVVSTGPLIIRFDGDTEPLAASPAALCAPVPGDRVWCQIYGRKVVALGIGGSAGDWVTITPTGGSFSGTFRGLRLGRQVQIQVDGSGSFPVGATTVGTVPAEWMPSGGNVAAGARLAGHAGTMSVTPPGGSIIVDNQTGATRASLRSTLTYWI